MPEKSAATFRREWNQEHTRLRKLLTTPRDFGQAKSVLIKHHAVLHTAQLEQEKHYSFQDEILRDLTDAQMRLIPRGKPHSAAWLLWHMTRIEDAAINVLLADTPQIFHSGKWQQKIGSPFADVGNEMSSQEIADLSRAVDVKALLAYRLAVGRQTQTVMQTLKADTLGDKPAPTRLEKLRRDGSVRVQAEWLLAYWGKHPQWNLLLMPATRHSFVHFNELARMLSALRRPA